MGRNHKNKKKMEWVGIAKKDGVGRNCKKNKKKMEWVSIAKKNMEWV